MLPDIETGSIAAQVTLQTWIGDPAIVVTSPPGAGKSRLIVTAASHLAARAKLNVGIACQTNVQAFDLAQKFAGVTDETGLFLIGASKASRPRALNQKVQFENNFDVRENNTGIFIATTAKMQWAQTENMFDILMVDEAYQCTWADFAAASHVGKQAVLVGDPGQIAPVVTGDISRYKKMEVGPHVASPEGLMRVHERDTLVYQLPSTWRCGPATTEALQPLYPFSFDSKRPPQHVTVRGTELPEIEVHAVSSYGHVDDPAVANAIAANVTDFLENGDVHEPDGTVRKPKQGDAAVIVAHNSQVAAVRSRLTKFPDVHVATTERLQGAEFSYVAAWSSAAAKRSLTPFDYDTGRLCVMLSRHTKHLAFFEREDTEERLNTHLQIENEDRETLQRFVDVTAKLRL